MNHFRILAWLYLVMGGISLAATGWFVYAIHGSGPGALSPEVQTILIDSGYGTGLLALLGFATVGTLFTGYALLRMHRFARTLAKAFAILGLLDFPLGTMLGVYTLWVLGREEKEKKSVDV